jgi:cytochrome c oxidase subunit 1
MFAGFNMLYGTFLVLGAMGMPRRYYAHLPQFHTGHLVATAGSWLLATGLALLFGNLLVALRRGRKAEANPWGGITLEWTIPSPPPHENFAEIPTITAGPYAYNPGRPG